MIDWSKLGKLILLRAHLSTLYEVIETEEIKKYRDIIQMFSDRLYIKIREVYRDYEDVVMEAEK